MDGKYYLRELERKLNESLSPLRRQLLKLEAIGVLISEEEANLKYYKLNKNFEGLQELKRFVLKEDTASEALPAKMPIQYEPAPRRKLKYDLVVLTGLSIFILIAAIYTVYINNKQINRMVSIISAKFEKNTIQTVHDYKKDSFTRQDEMASKKWKILPGTASIFSGRKL